MQDKAPKLASLEAIDEIEYFENPFLLLYKPGNLYQLAHRLGMTKSADTWEPTKQAVAMVLNITTGFSHKLNLLICNLRNAAKYNLSDN